MVDDLAKKYGFADPADDGEDPLAKKYGFSSPRSWGQRFSDAYIDSASRAELGGGVTWARQYYKKQGFSDKQIDVAIRRIQENTAKKNAADPASRGFNPAKPWDILRPENLSRYSADFLGGVIGGVDPTYVVSAGKNAATRIATQAGVNAGESAASQKIQKDRGIRDDFSWGEVGLNAAAGAGFQGGSELSRKAAQRIVRPNSDLLDLDSAVGIGNKFGTVTSTIRTPKRNKQVGGVPNSYHLKGQAVDIARGKGVSHKQIERAYRKAGFDIIESLDEGDHSHLAFRFGKGKKPVAANDAAPIDTEAGYRAWEDEQVANRFGEEDIRPEDIRPADGSDELLSQAEDNGDWLEPSDGFDHLDLNDEFFANEVNRRLKDPSYELADVEQQRIKEMVESDPANINHFPDLGFQGPDGRVLRFDAKEGDWKPHASVVRIEGEGPGPQRYTDEQMNEGLQSGKIADLDRVRSEKELAAEEASNREYEKQLDDNYWMSRHILDKAKRGEIKDEHIPQLQDMLDEWRADLDDPTFTGDHRDLVQGAHDNVQAAIAHSGHKPNVERPSSVGKFVNRTKQVLKDLANDDSGELRGDDEGPIGEDSPAVAKLRQALKDAKPIRREQNKVQSQVRSERLREVNRVMQSSSGEMTHGRALEQLRGALPKADFESIRENFTQTELDEIFDLVRTHPRLNDFDRINAMNGLAKMFDRDVGQVPTDSELEVLKRVLPKDVIDGLRNNRQFREKLQRWVAEGLNLPRSLMASFDLSAPFRQGVFLIHKPAFWKSFATMFRIAGSERAWEGLQDSIAARPTHNLMLRAGLALTKKSENLADREEAFMSTWAERIPGIGRIVKGSNRAYTGFLNKLRADVFDEFVSKYHLAGIDLSRDEKALKDIARYINNATGRGDLGPKLNAAAPALAGAFFSPRLMASRVNMLNPVFYGKLSPMVRKEAIKSLLAFGGIVTTALTLAGLAGAEVETDMRSANFGKAKVGNTRFDMTGGFSSYLRLGAQLWTGQTKTLKGEEKDFGKDVMVGTRADAIERFFRSKESPLASLFHDMMAGKSLDRPKDVIGQEHTIPEAVMQRFLPMISQDIWDVYKEYGTAAAVGVGVPAVFGVGVQTYKPKGQSLEEKTGFGSKSVSSSSSKDSDDLAEKYGFR